MLRSLVPEYPVLPARTRDLVLLQVEDAVRRHRSLLPGYLRYPMVALSAVFESLPIVWKGRPYSRLTTDQQRGYLAAWEASPLAAFVHFHRSLVVLTFLDHPTVREHLDDHE